jgi:hypothetical protein
LPFLLVQGAAQAALSAVMCGDEQCAILAENACSLVDKCRILPFCLFFLEIARNPAMVALVK